MELKITIDSPDFDKNPQKSKTNNHNWRQGTIVEFPNCISTKTNKSFKWMPTYKQLEEIKKSLDTAEEINKIIARDVIKNNA